MEARKNQKVGGEKYECLDKETAAIMRHLTRD